MIQHISNGVGTPSLADLSRRNLLRWQRSLLDLLGSLPTESHSDNQLRAFLVERLAEVAALMPCERQAVG